MFLVRSVDDGGVCGVPDVSLHVDVGHGHDVLDVLHLDDDVYAHAFRDDVYGGADERLGGGRGDVYDDANGADEDVRQTL